MHYRTSLVSVGVMLYIYAFAVSAQVSILKVEVYSEFQIPPEAVHLSLKKGRSRVLLRCVICHLYTFLISSNIHV